MGTPTVIRDLAPQTVEKPTNRPARADELKDRAARAIPRVPVYLILGLWAAFNILVLLWLVISSFKTNRELYADVWALPSSLGLDNFVKAWTVVKMQAYFINSVIIVVAAVLLTIAVSAPAAYALTRIPFRGAKSIVQFFTAGMGVPAAVLFIPLFGMLSAVGLVDSLPGLILVYICLSIPFTVFLLTGFFATLPAELEEAAAIDGASPLQGFLQVMLPLAQPGLLTAAILNFILIWNEYLVALIFITTDAKRTISLGLYSLMSSMQYTGDWVGMFAGVVIVLLPTLIMYIILSERMISGITMGAVKS